MELRHPAVLAGVLSHLRLADALQLSRVSKGLRAEVVAAWPTQAPSCRVLALVVASSGNELLLLNALTGVVEARTLVRAAPPANGDIQDYWPPCVGLDVPGRRCFVSQYSEDSVLEFALPSLRFVRRHTRQELAPPGRADMGEPEGVRYSGGVLYVAWSNAEDACLTATRVPDAGAPPPQGQQPPTGQRTLCKPPPGEELVMWGAALGPGNTAMFAAANPPYRCARYTSTPPQRGKGCVVRAVLDAAGLLTGSVERFCGDGHLSRPSGLCFDDAGRLYVTHMASQVLRFQGPQGPQPGRFVGVFIDTADPRHQLGPAAGDSRAHLRRRASRRPQELGKVPAPQPMDACWLDGILYLTTHTGSRGDRNHGCLSLWDERGQLLRVHRLAGHHHPNGVAVFSAAALPGS